MRKQPSSAIFAALRTTHVGFIIFGLMVGAGIGQINLAGKAVQRAAENDPEPMDAPANNEDDATLKLDEFLPYQLAVVASLVSQALSRVYARRYKIGVPEWRVLVTLGQFGVLTGKAIGVRTLMHKTKVSRAVAVLEKRKLLVRKANRADMRESFISLTASGRTMYEELAPHAVEFNRKLTEILAPGDREAFNRALQHITERSARLAEETAEDDKPARKA